MEIWKPVKGYSYYEVSDQGRVRSLDKKVPSGIKHNKTITKYGRTLKTSLKKNGYLAVALVGDDRKSTISVHRLVAINHIANPNNLPMVNHRNGNKTDNRAKNLEWCDAIHNAQHAQSNGLKSPSSLRKKITCVETGQAFDSSYQAAEWVNVKHLHSKQIAAMSRKIRAAATGRQKTAYGYHWKDIESA